MNQTEKKLLGIAFLSLVGIIIIIYLLLTGGKYSALSSDGGTSTTLNLACSNGGQSQCTTTCTRPTTPEINIPTDSATCRNYATSNGFQGSTFQIDLTSLTSCQNYVYSKYCSTPSRVLIEGNCCMWRC